VEVRQDMVDHRGLREASYMRNPSTGFDEFLFTCRIAVSVSHTLRKALPNEL
jgi:hypothetical protein